LVASSKEKRRRGGGKQYSSDREPLGKERKTESPLLKKEKSVIFWDPCSRGGKKRRCPLPRPPKA